jgi:alkanesulfonate monooxygenase SsuD/methylene tetrahydromethanopterin reductase-like flavin-dependent oxidoreductase (luciferase family)
VLDGRLRFAMVANPTDALQWRIAVRQAEELGYDTLLTADNLNAPAPAVSLGMAAGLAERLRLGTLVMAGPLRMPRAAAWEAHSLSVLSGRRFEFGIGTGNPMMRAAAHQLGLPRATSALERVAATVRALRELDGDEHTPVMIPAAGPRARALAAEIADIVMVAAPALATREEVAKLVQQIRADAGDRPIEFAMAAFVVEDQLEPWAENLLGASADALIAADSLSLLRGTPAEMADELLRRRDQLGVTYFSVLGRNTDLFAPVLDRLVGH